MSLEDNNGTQYYFVSCGVPSDPDVALSANNGSKYYYNEANDYILYGQNDILYPQPQGNNGSELYLLNCSIMSSPGLDLQANNGTHYYQSSSFNCVRWCAGGVGAGDITDIGDDMVFIYDDWLPSSGTSLGASDELLAWEGTINGHILQTNSLLPLANRAKVINSEYVFIDGINNSTGRRMSLSASDFGGNQPRARRTFWVLEVDFSLAIGSSILDNTLLVVQESPSVFTIIRKDHTGNFIQIVPPAGSNPDKMSLSAYPSGYNKILIETGTPDNGDYLKINNTTQSLAVVPATSVNFWVIGNFRTTDSSHTNNTIPVRVLETVFMKHPNTATALPLSSSDKVRDYLVSKHGITLYG